MAKHQNELVEHNESPILLEKADDGYHYAKFLVTTIGQRNKNGRVYPESVIARELSQTMRNDILGQDTHPTETPKFTNQFLIWQEFMREGDKEYARAKVVPTFPDGENFIKLAKAGAMASCSRRGIGSVREGTVNGQKAMIVQDDYRITGIDILPPHTQSDHNAYLTRFEAYNPDEDTSIQEENEMPEQTANEAENKTAPETVTNESTSAVQATSDTKPVEPVVESNTDTAPAVNPSEVIERLTTQVQAQETLIAEKNVKIAELAADKATKEEQIKAMTVAIDAANAEQLRLSKAISEQHSTVEERTKMIRERDETLARRNKDVAERQELLMAAHRTIAERDTTIAERNLAVTQKNSFIALRDETIAARDKELAERNETIAKQDRQIQDRDTAIAEKDTLLANLHAQLAERDATVVSQDATIAERDAELVVLNDKLLAEQVNVTAEKEKNKAFQFLLEKVQIEGGKAQWLIFGDLRNCATVQEVEEKFAASKEKNLTLIEGVARVAAGRAVYTETAQTDADDVNKPSDNKSTKKTDTTANDATRAKRDEMLARLAGL